MRSRYPNRATWVALAPVLVVATFVSGTFVLAPPATAQPASSTTGLRIASPAEALALQARMHALVERVSTLVEESPGLAPYRGSLDDARAALAKMTWEDFSYAPTLGSEIESLERALVELDFVRSTSGNGDATRVSSASATLPSASYPDEPWGFSFSALTETPSGGDDSSSNAGVCSLATVVTAGQSFTLLNLGYAVDALADTAARLCDQIIVVLGAGANAALLCIVTEILRAAAIGIVDHELLCADIITAAEVTGNYNRLEHVHGDLETAETNLTTEVNVNETKLIDVTTDLAAHDANLNARADAIDQALGDQADFLEAFRALMLRLDIEMHLSETSTKAISSFRFPEAAGGYFETVADVVEEAIFQLLAAGQTVGRAQSLFGQAEDAATAGDYAAALDLFGRAYRQAVK